MVFSFPGTTVEDVQQYWNRRPCNIRHSLKPVGTREYFDEVEARKYFVEPHISAFADFGAWRGKKVLEIGCGIGTDTINFARAGARVTAVDLSEESLKVARRRAAVMNVEDSITFYQANAEALSQFVPPEDYDLVYSFGAIHHTLDPAAVLTGARRYLRAGGTLKVMVYHRWSWKVLCILFGHGHGNIRNLDALISRYSEAQTGCPVTYAYSRSGARRLLESHGFKVSGIRTDHIFPYRIADYVNYRYVKEWHFRVMPNWLFHRLERVLGWHLCLTARAE